MLLEESSARAARNDTLTQRAPERALLQIAELYAQPWFVGQAVTLDAQRAFMRASQLGARGTFTGFFSLVRALFSSSIQDVSATLTRTSTGSYITSASLSADWGRDRLIEIKKSVGAPGLFTSINSLIQSNELRIFLSPSRSSKHDAHPPFVLTPISESVTVRLLPFRLKEPNPLDGERSDLKRPAEIILEIEESALINPPAGYYRTNGNGRTLDPQGLHYVAAAASGSNAGPFPLYYDVEGSELSRYVERALDLFCAAGVTLKTRRF